MLGEKRLKATSNAYVSLAEDQECRSNSSTTFVLFSTFVIVYIITTAVFAIQVRQDLSITVLLVNTSSLFKINDLALSDIMLFSSFGISSRSKIAKGRKLR